MSFTTITEDEQNGMGVSGLPDTPALDTADMQEKFDELGNAAIDWIQTHVTELEANTAAVSIGCAIPSGISTSTAKLQSVINAVASLAVANNGKSHTHSNKAVLDGITSDLKAKYDNLATIFGSASYFDSENLIPSTTAIPSSQAVATYVTAFDIAAKLLVKAYPVGSCYIGPTSPATFLGGTWTQVNDTGISNSYTVWKRTA